MATQANSSVSIPSADYDLMVGRWKEMRDCYAGSHAVKDAGTDYLPALQGHDPTRKDDAYWGYVDRALFYNATGRSIDGLVGMVFRKTPKLSMPEQADWLVEDVDLQGRSLVDLAQIALAEGLTVARRGLLVDHTVRERGGRLARPYMVLYQAEQILDTLFDTDIQGRRRLVRVRLRESVERPSSQDEFASEVEERVRVLELFDPVFDAEGADQDAEPDPARMIYRQRVYRLVEGDQEKGTQDRFELVEEPRVPLGFDGNPLDFIPFWPMGTGSALTPGEIEVPPLLDLADVNLSHYRTMADIENAAHFAGIPTAVFTGIDMDSDIKLGTQEAVILPVPEASAFILSYGGDGLAALEQRASSKEQMMAFLGARMLQPEKRQVEAAETAAIHRQGEISVLGTLANAQSRAMTAALQFMLAWAGIKGADTAEFKLNDDYVPIQAASNMLTAMLSTWQAGGISFETFWSFLQQNELANPTRTAEDEMRAIDKEKAARVAEQEAQEAQDVPFGAVNGGAQTPELEDNSDAG